MTTSAFIHVLISLIAIASGFVVLWQLLTAKRLDGWALFFLLMIFATSATGFAFPFTGFTPAIGTGIVALVVLAPALLARYTLKLAGAWRGVYVIGAVVSLYLNVFVLFVQSF